MQHKRLFSVLVGRYPGFLTGDLPGNSNRAATRAQSEVAQRVGGTPVRISQAARHGRLEAAFSGLWSIWQANETLILTGEPNGYWDQMLLYCGRKNGAMRLRWVNMAEDDRCLWFCASSLCCAVVGKSDHAAAETSAFLWGLDQENGGATIRCLDQLFDFGVFFDGAA